MEKEKKPTKKLINFKGSTEEFVKDVVKFKKQLNELEDKYQILLDYNKLANCVKFSFKNKNYTFTTWYVSVKNIDQDENNIVKQVGSRKNILSSIDKVLAGGVWILKVPKTKTE